MRVSTDVCHRGCNLPGSWEGMVRHMLSTDATVLTSHGEKCVTKSLPGFAVPIVKVLDLMAPLLTFSLACMSMRTDTTKLAFSFSVTAEFCLQLLDTRQAGPVTRHYVHSISSLNANITVAASRNGRVVCCPHMSFCMCAMYVCMIILP